MKHYTEGTDSTVTHDGQLYQLDKIFKMTHDSDVIEIDVTKLAWIVEQHKNKDPDFIKRMNAADTKVPIVVTPWAGQWMVIDGFHRLAKAIHEGKKTIKAKVIREKDLKKALIK